MKQTHLLCTGTEWRERRPAQFLDENNGTWHERWRALEIERSQTDQCVADWRLDPQGRDYAKRYVQALEQAQCVLIRQVLEAPR